MALDPGVEGRLRLFEQRDVAVAGLLGGFLRELARHRVEGGGHGDQHLLLGERRIRHLGVPGVAQVLQILRGGFHRREFLHALGRASRAGARECDRRRHARARISRTRPGGRRFRRRASARAVRRRIRAARSRASASRACREIGRAGQIEERRQQGLFAHFAGIHQLRDRRTVDVAERPGRSAGGIRIGQRGVGGAEVDSDDVARHAYSTSISAGAMMACPACGLSGGRFTDDRAPAFMAQSSAGAPVAGTLPSNFTMAGSFDGGLGERAFHAIDHRARGDT